MSSTTSIQTVRLHETDTEYYQAGKVCNNKRSSFTTTFVVQVCRTQEPPRVELLIAFHVHKYQVRQGHLNIEQFQLENNCEI